MKDYYAILGVEKTADQKEIKRAYNKKMQIYHPDSGSEAVKAQAITDEKERDKKMKEIKDLAMELNEARETLCDEKKRKIYDSGGSEQQFGGFGGFGGFDFSSFFQQKATEQRVVSITLKESFCGVEKKLKIKNRSACEACHGVGGTHLVTCRKCNGTGVGERISHLKNLSFSQNGPCETCEGRGKQPSKICTECAGKKVKISEDSLTISIPQGVPSKMGLQMSDNENLIFVIEVKEEENRKRIKNNLIVNIQLELGYAYGGFIRFEHLDGRILKIKLKKLDALGPAIKVAGEGFLWDGKKGDLFLVPQWKLPPTPTINMKLDANFEGELRNAVYENEPKEEGRRKKGGIGIEDIFSGGFGGFGGFGF